MLLFVLFFFFKMFAAFKAWKADFEKSTVSLFVTRRGKYNYGGQFFECHVSGSRKRKSKSTGQRKPRTSHIMEKGRCTAGICATPNTDGTISVTVFKTHYGHENKAETLPGFSRPGRRRKISAGKMQKPDLRKVGVRIFDDIR